MSFAANDHDGAGAVDGRQGSPGDDAAAVAELRRCAADIITDHLAEITSTGINLTSERHLDADIIGAATGLNVLAIGGIGLTVDGREITLSDTVAHKGRMLSGVPNFALTVGYTNASWTLKADLVAHDVCRLLRYMAAGGYQVVTPIAPELGPGELAPLIDLDAGYIRRSIAALPRQGPSTPWRLRQNYLLDLLLMRRGPLTDGVRFGHTGDPAIGPGLAVTVCRGVSCS